jgi:hypothetical protein
MRNAVKSASVVPFDETPEQKKQALKPPSAKDENPHTHSNQLR